MPDATFEPLGDIHMRDALVIMAFPSVGSAGSIAAHFLQQHFALPLVGQVRVEGMTGAVAVHEGVATSPIRVFGGELACDLDGHCPFVYVVATEIQLPPEAVEAATLAVLAAAREGGAKMVMSFDAVRRGDEDKTPDVYLVATTAEDVRVLSEEMGVPGVDRALLLGVTAELLSAAPGAGVRAAAVLVEAQPDLPDARAAAALIRALDKMIPEVKMDTQPLLAEAEDIEAQLRQAQETMPANVHMGTFI